MNLLACNKEDSNMKLEETERDTVLDFLRIIAQLITGVPCIIQSAEEFDE